MSIDSTGHVAGISIRQQRDKELKKACQDFESIFTYELLKSMRKTIDKCELFHGGEGEEIYESLLDQELAKNVSGYGSNSLSELLYQQMSRTDSVIQAGAGGSETHPSPVSERNEQTSHKAHPSQVQKVSRRHDTESVAISTGDSQTDRRSGAESTADNKPEWPLKSVVSSKFGFRKDPFTSGKKFHSGIDIAAAEGTVVKAALPGKVIMSRNMGGYGNVVALDHGDGLITVYAHNEKNMVKAGDKVEKGAAIAKVGSTGRSTGPHLHFEVRKDGTKINPMSFLGIV